jgi:hypothetical protein
MSLSPPRDREAGHRRDSASVTRQHHSGARKKGPLPTLGAGPPHPPRVRGLEGGYITKGSLYGATRSGWLPMTTEEVALPRREQSAPADQSSPLVPRRFPDLGVRPAALSSPWDTQPGDPSMLVRADRRSPRRSAAESGNFPYERPIWLTRRVQGAFGGLVTPPATATGCAAARADRARRSE